MMQRTYAVVAIIVLAWTFAACAGGDTKASSTTATASAATASIALARGATATAVSEGPPPMAASAIARDRTTTSVDVAYYKKLESVIAKAESAVTTATANGAAVSEDAVKAYVDFEAGLRDLVPPAPAAEAYARLFDAVRMLVGFAKKYQANGAPTPDATAEAEVIPAISGFASACTELQSLAKSADPAINLRCEE